MHPYARVLDSKAVEGHGTEAMAPSKRQEQVISQHPVAKTIMMVEKNPPPWESMLTLQSVEEVPQLKGADTEWLPQPRFEFGVAFS